MKSGGMGDNTARNDASCAGAASVLGPRAFSADNVAAAEPRGCGPAAGAKLASLRTCAPTAGPGSLSSLLQQQQQRPPPFLKGWGARCTTEAELKDAMDRAIAEPTKLALIEVVLHKDDVTSELRAWAYRVKNAF